MVCGHTRADQRNDASDAGAAHCNRCHTKTNEEPLKTTKSAAASRATAGRGAVIPTPLHNQRPKLRTTEAIEYIVVRGKPVMKLP